MPAIVVQSDVTSFGSKRLAGIDWSRCAFAPENLGARRDATIILQERRSNTFLLRCPSRRG